MVGITKKMRGLYINKINQNYFQTPGVPPLASSETLFSGSMLHDERRVQMMSWEQFSKLDPECKNSEIQRLLPLVSAMSEDIVSIQRDCNTVHTKLHEIK